MVWFGIEKPPRLRGGFFMLVDGCFIDTRKIAGSVKIMGYVTLGIQ
jgi:hypothetical protein